MTEMQFFLPRRQHSAFSTVIFTLTHTAALNGLSAGAGIVFLDEVDKIHRTVSQGHGTSSDVGGEGVQQALLKILEGNRVYTGVVSVNAYICVSAHRPLQSHHSRKPRPSIPLSLPLCVCACVSTWLGILPHPPAIEERSMERGREKIPSARMTY